jgi:bacteriorhodopsin|tara:strand:- start:1812 stop:2522 length:711 start_codon:yes stop_codon:yes gene_type:complete
MDKIFLAVELQVGDTIGFTFFLTSIAMLAATVFFFIERGSVAEKWKLSLTVSGLITGIAAVHYYYMRTVWIETGMSPTEFRYIDWILTVPLMCVEFYLLTGVGLKKMVTASIIMLITGYFGEAGLLPVANIGPAFWGLLSGLAYLFIVNEVYRGEIALAAAKASKKIANANSLLLKFIIIGWGIYPLGYLIGTGDGQWYSVINGIIDTDARELIYNIGDAVNKIGFGLVIWSVAKK